MGYWTALVRATPDRGQVVDIHFYTILIGNFVAQVVRPEPAPPTYGALRTTSEPLSNEIPVFPPVENFHWPPARPFDRGAFEQYTRRGITLPPEWAVDL